MLNYNHKNHNTGSHWQDTATKPIVCVPQIKESKTGLERHEGWIMMTRFSFLFYHSLCIAKTFKTTINIYSFISWKNVLPAREIHTHTRSTNLVTFLLYSMPVCCPCERSNISHWWVVGLVRRHRGEVSSAMCLTADKKPNLSRHWSRGPHQGPPPASGPLL